MKIKKIAFVSIVIGSIFVSTNSSFAETVQSTEVDAFYKKYASISDSLPLPDESKYQSFRSLEELSPNIERSSDAKIIDENGVVFDTYHIESNMVDSNTKSISTKEGYLATVMIVADEEYRAAHPNWMDLTKNIVEATDDAFVRDFNIDLTVESYRFWTSNITGDAAAILKKIKGKGTDQYDFVIAFIGDSNFTTNGIDIGGKAYQYASPPPYAAYSAISDINPIYAIYALQHELSHNYGLGHDSEDKNSTYPVCIMNYGTTYETTLWHTTHKEELGLHRGWYGTSF